MTVTANLGLTTNDTSSGSVTTFLTWRLSINGISSNMSLIDTWAGLVSGSITALQAVPVTKRCSAVYTSPSYYEATVAGLTYVTNQMIALSLDVTNDGTTTLNINALGTKILQKVGLSGSAVNLDAYDLVKDRTYLFQYNGTAWQWVNNTSGAQLSVPGNPNEIVVLSSGSGIISSGSLITSKAPSSGSYILSAPDARFPNARVLTTSATNTITNASASIVTINTVSQLDGWILANQTWSYLSGSGITVPSGAAAIYSKGDRIKLTQDTVKYFVIVGVASTVLTITGGDDYTLENMAISTNYYSKVASPVGYPTSFNFTTTITWTAGTAPSGSPSLNQKFSVVGGLCTVNIYNSGYTAGVTVTGASFPLPVAGTSSGGANASITVASEVVAGYGMVLATSGYLYCASNSATRLRFNASYAF